MKIRLQAVGKRYRTSWVFKNINYSFEVGTSYALLGKNGSGKSTLLRIIAGMQLPTAGKVIYDNKEANLPAEKFFRQLAYCAPEMELIEELTLEEYLRFHFHFKAPLNGHTPSHIINQLGLKKHAANFLHDFSSGMKQRVKLAQAFYSDTPVLLLDEPCSNLDQAGIDLYRYWLQTLAKDRLVLIASNDEKEYGDAKEQLHLQNYSPDATATSEAGSRH